MAIDLSKEKLYLLRDLARKRIFPIQASYRTLLRYNEEGQRNASGVVVFLECLITPQGRATTEEACRRFIEDLNC